MCAVPQLQHSPLYSLQSCTCSRFYCRFSPYFLLAQACAVRLINGQAGLLRPAERRIKASRCGGRQGSDAAKEAEGSKCDGRWGNPPSFTSEILIG